MDKFSTYLLLIVVPLMLSGCGQRINDPIDTKTNLRKSDFDRYVTKKAGSEEKRREKALKQNKSRSIPSISSIKPRPPKQIKERDFLDQYQNVSFSVTDDTPLKDVLIELGRIAKLDVELDPNITGGIVISAHKKPLGQIVKRICRLGNLRYEFKNGVLRFERDLPYTKNYFVDYLKEGSDLWTEVDNNIKQLLQNERSSTTTMLSESGQDNIPISSMTINKSAGILTIYAPKRHHDAIQRYLYDVEEMASAQVLIEAKVVEVQLSDEFRAGINWDLTGKSPSTGIKTDGGFSAIGEGAASAFSFVTGGDIASSVSALEKFGTTRTLSSPRIHAINNRKSILNFTKKLVYFQIQADTTTTGGLADGQTTFAVTSTRLEEEEGVKLTIIPSINLKSNEITMHIKPIITVNSGYIDDPASVQDQNGNTIATNQVPQMQTREIDTVAKITDGNVIVIGGLMQESTTNTDSGVPFLQRIPLIGNLFKSTSKESTITETVIFIKATIVKSSDSVDKNDRNLQEKFDTNVRGFF